MDKFQQKIKSAGQLVKHFQSISLADLTKISIETALKIIASETRKSGARKTAEWAAFWIDFAGLDVDWLIMRALSRDTDYFVEKPAMIFSKDTPEQRIFSRLESNASEMLFTETKDAGTAIANNLLILTALRL